MESDVYLAVIDMSLPLGGLFDINGRWTTPHELHRTGKSVDFTTFYRDASGGAIFVDIFIDGTLRSTTNKINQTLLDQLFSRRGFRRLERPSKIHYESNK
jgi:hypothetical protein